MHGHGHGMAYDYHASLVLTCKGFVGDGVIGANAAAEVEEGRKEERRELVKQQRWQRTKCRQRRQGCHTRTLWSRRSTRMLNHRYCKLLPLVKWLRNEAILLFSVVAVVFGVREVGGNNTYAFYEGNYSVLMRVFGSPFLSRCSSSSSRCSRSFIISTYRSSSCKFSGNNRFKRSSKWTVRIAELSLVFVAFLLLYVSPRGFSRWLLFLFSLSLFSFSHVQSSEIISCH